MKIRNLVVLASLVGILGASVAGCMRHRHGGLEVDIDIHSKEYRDHHKNHHDHDDDRDHGRNRRDLDGHPIH